MFYGICFSPLFNFDKIPKTELCVYCEESYSTQSSGRQEHNTRTHSCLVRMLATHATACLMGGRGGGGDVGRQEARESGASFALCSHLPSWGQSILSET